MSRIGNKTINIPDGVTVGINNSLVNIKGPKGTLEVTIPDPISLEIVGVGYRAEQKGKNVTLSVMLSHTVTIEPPEGIEVQVQDNLIHVKGIDKQKVGQVSAEIRSVRPPNAYTGKGIRYQGEQVKIKPGKSARRTE